jgi:N4-gp56 family major capsid protein
MYLSGARGVNADYTYNKNYTGRAGNALVAPDSMHYMLGGVATSKATLAATDTFDLKLINRLVARASTMGGGTENLPAIEPMSIDGESHYVSLIHPWQAFDLRTSVGTGGWLDLQKAASAAEGRNNPIFKGGLGMHNNVIIHEHKSVVRFSDFGAGSNVPAARSLFLGRQAGVVAFGSAGTGLRFDWTEEQEDRGNQVVITTGSIFGMKKTAFVIDGVSRDFGVIAADTAVKDPG